MFTKKQTKDFKCANRHCSMKTHKLILCPDLLCPDCFGKIPYWLVDHFEDMSIWYFELIFLSENNGQIKTKAQQILDKIQEENQIIENIFVKSRNINFRFNNLKFFLEEIKKEFYELYQEDGMETTRKNLMEIL